MDRIKASSLAAEVIAEPNFDPQHVANALIGLGRIARKYSDPHELAQWPACVVVELSYKALEDYEQGAFWDRFSTAFTERRVHWTSDDNTLWGDAFLLTITARSSTSS